MLNTFIRVTIIYILVLVIMRLMGKREIGQMQPFELVIAIMIADLASVPMADIGIPITSGIIPILALLVFQLIISILNLKSIRIREILCGKPRILIFRGKIDEKALRKEKITINELQEKLRQKDCFSLEEAEYAILETSGDLSIIQRSDTSDLPYDLVIDGKIMSKNLKKINKNKEWLNDELKKINISVKEALIVTYNEKGQIFFQKKENK